MNIEPLTDVPKVGEYILFDIGVYPAQIFRVISRDEFALNNKGIDFGKLKHSDSDVFCIISVYRDGEMVSGDSIMYWDQVGDLGSFQLINFDVPVYGDVLTVCQLLTRQSKDPSLSECFAYGSGRD